MVTHPAERPATERGSIAFICHVLDHPYLFHVLMGIARTAAENHRNLQVISSYDTDDVEARHVKEAIALNVEGIIVFPHHRYQNQALYEELQRARFPLVMVDRYYPQIDTDRVVFNDETAAYQLVSRLIAKGRRRNSSDRAKSTEFFQKLKRHGLRRFRIVLGPAQCDSQ